MPSNLLQESSSLIKPSDLEGATATTGDVLNGKTFFAGDKELKTGTLSLSGNATASDVLSGKTFYSTSTNKLTGTMTNRGSSATASSTKVSGSNVQMVIPGGYYNNNATISDSRADVLTAMNLNFSGNWECIAWGCYPGKLTNKDDMINCQKYLTWANGWSANLPTGTYRVMYKFGYCTDGAVWCWVWIGNTKYASSFRTYWNGEDITCTNASGNLRISFGEDGLYASRQPNGFCGVVLHKR